MKSKLPINEIFGPTIQGEGLYTGHPVYFIRMAYCDNKCTFCDTQKAWNKVNAEMSPDEIVSKLDASISNVVVITGGNPCIHDLSDLIDELHANKFVVHIETQGTVAPKWLQDIEAISISPKAPSSGSYTELYKLMTVLDKVAAKHIWKAIKVVVDIDNEEDWKYVNDIAMLFPEVDIDIGRIPLIIQVKDDMTKDFNLEDYANTYKKTVEKYLDKVKKGKIRGGIRILPQMHKIIWNRKEGV